MSATSPAAADMQKQEQILQLPAVPLQMQHTAKARASLVASEQLMVEIQMSALPADVKKRKLSAAWRKRMDAVASLYRGELKATARGTTKIRS